MAYYTLISRDADSKSWGIQFGDYERASVNAELQDLKKDNKVQKIKEEFKIIKSKTASQASVNKAIRDFTDSERN